MYLTYAEYTAKGGTQTSTAYPRLETNARMHIDRLTHSRITEETTVRESVKNLMFELVEYLAANEESQKSGITSFSNGSVSATYATPQAQRGHIAQLASDYLSNEVTDDESEIPLMYAGVIY